MIERLLRSQVRSNE